MTDPLDRLARAAQVLESGAAALVRRGGTVHEVATDICRVRGLSDIAALGDCVALETEDGALPGQVVHLSRDEALVKPFSGEAAIRLGMRVWHEGPFRLRPHESWKGRTINALGAAIDGGPPLVQGERALAVDRAPPAALQRQRTGGALKTGVRAVDLFTPVCFGQRLGVFAGSGVGKTTFLSMLARSSGFDTVVLALIGERGREVREFMEDVLAPEQRARTVSVVATGDESPMMRRLALKSAITVAEYFRDAGEEVLLIADSITRYAHACRDILLAAGEPPVARGYPPGIFSDLPRLLERTGPGPEGVGNITAFLSVLVDGDDHNDPVADNIRGILDGHIVLDRDIAEQGRYPAINVLASVSRLARRAWTKEQEELILMLKALITRYEDTRDLRLLGGYQPGADAELDRAVQWVPRIYEVLKQGPEEPPCEDAFAALATALKEDAGDASKADSARLPAN